MKAKVALTVVVVMVTVCSSLGADWPQWRGPKRDGKSADAGLLKEWPSDGPPLAWKIDKLGGGYSAPAIAAGRVYGMGNRGEDEVVWALSEKDGSEIWATRLGPAFAQRPSQGREGPACTPTVDGERLYVEGLGGNVACLQVKDGKIIWQVSMTEEFGGRVPMWSYRESPLIDGDKVICTPGGDDAMLVALNKLTGETIWKSKVPEAPASDSGSSSGRPDGPAGPPGGFPSVMQFDRILAALDVDGNKEISADEISSAPTALGKLDRNQDGNITGDEVRGDFGGRGGGPGGQGGPQGRPEGPGGPARIMRFLPVHAALDADESGEIDPTEIKNSVAALRKLDGNGDGKLTEDEVRPQFGGGRDRGGSRGGRGGSGGRRGGFGGGGGAAYASVIAIDFGGQRQYVQLTARALIGVAASDGKFLWRYDKPANRMGINCTTPVFHDGMLFASSAYGAGAGLVKLSKDADGSVKAEEVYATTDMQNHHGGMILLDGYLYGASGGNEGGALVCLDFQSGKVLWDQRDSAGRRAKGSVALADGRLYYRMEDGTVLLIEPSPKQYIERGRFEQPDRSSAPAWPHPVIANGRLYLRDQDILFCYDIKAK